MQVCIKHKNKMRERESSIEIVDGLNPEKKNQSRCKLRVDQRNKRCPTIHRINRCCQTVKKM